MWIVKAYRGDGEKPLVVVDEVEAVQHGEQTLYRHLRSGRVEPLYEFMGERVVETRGEAVAVVEAALEGYAAEYAANCRAAVGRLRAGEGVAV
jgi:hypothetical protein